MNEITIKTQAEFDALPDKFDTYTRIIIQNDPRIGRISVATKRENSSVVAWGNSSVVACGNSSVVAWGNSSVVARENSSVVACGNSSVVAWENSSVVACGNSSVVAWGNVGVHLSSTNASATLFGFAVCWLLVKGKAQKKSKTATIIKPTKAKNVKGWLEAECVKSNKGITILFKRVSSDFKTQEGTSNETSWATGTKLTHSAWDPTTSECGEGKFHACSRPYFCDEFRSNNGDKYIAIKVNVKDLHVWKNANYPHKIAFREGTVMYECDKFGKKL